MNEHDSERIRGVLEAEGWEEAAAAESADLLVFNTCSVRASAVSRLKGRLGEASRLKRERPGRLVALGGCFAQDRQDEIFDELPFLDIAFGPENIGELPALVREASESSRGAGAFGENPHLSADLPSHRQSSYHAWVQAMTGCTNFCSYCIVPYVRGPERSRPAGSIVEEVKRLANEGVVEITLLGQNVNAYGQDLSPEGPSIDFAGLLEKLDAVDGLKRIRFTTSHPKDLDRRLIEAMRDLPAVCEHLHLPVQSGADRVLGRMNRGYTRQRYLELVDAFYEAVPAMALTTDIIVGFPGEKEEDFFRTMTLVEHCRFDGAFTFRYSPREGTEAATLAGAVPEVTIKRRMRELVALTQVIATAKNKDLVGSLLDVMVEGPSRHGAGRWRSRTRGNKIVNFEPLEGVKPAPGDIVMVRVHEVTSTTLTATEEPVT